MSYTAKTAKELREQAGSLLSKLAGELSSIQAALTALGSGSGALADGKVWIGDALGACAQKTMSGDATMTREGVISIGAQKLDGAHAKNTAEDNVIGGLAETFMINIDAGAIGDKDITVTHKVRVLDAHVILRGAGVESCTGTLKNAANAITDAMALSGSDKAIIRAASIDDATYEIGAGGTLRFTTAVGATQPECLVVVNAIRVA